MVCDWLKLRNDRPAISKSLSQAMVILILFMDQQPRVGLSTRVRRDIEIFILSCLQNIKDVKALLVPDFLKSQVLFDFKSRAANFLSNDGRPTLAADLYEELIDAL